MSPSLRAFILAIVTANVLLLPTASAQVPARFYWKTLAGGNAVPLIVNSISGNTNPFDPAHVVTPGADFDGTLAITGYAHTFALFDRASMAAILVPMGCVSGDVTVAGTTFNQSADGFGDPMLELAINIIGPKAQKNVRDDLRLDGFMISLVHGWHPLLAGARRLKAE